MTSLKLTLALFAAAVAATGMSSYADATPFWQSPAGGCVPYNSSIQADGYDLADTGGQASFTTGTTANQYFVCSVQPTRDIDGDTLELLLYSTDPDNGGANTYVQATLYRKSRSTGSYSSVCSVTSTSNASWNVDGSGSCGTLDTDTYIYWVFVRMIRDGSQATKFYAAELDVWVN
jgi:hypothetical protein